MTRLPKDDRILFVLQTIISSLVTPEVLKAVVLKAVRALKQASKVAAYVGQQSCSLCSFVFLFFFGGKSLVENCQTRHDFQRFWWVPGIKFGKETPNFGVYNDIMIL